MDMSFEDQIRERAYQIWLAGGMADGQAHDHWMCAEQAVLDEVAESAAEEPVVILTKAEPKPAKPRKAAAKLASAKLAPAKLAAAKPAAAKAPRARKAKAEH